MDDDPDWVPYSQRPEWSDVTPTPLPDVAAGDDGSVAGINYSRKHREVLGYFRACMDKVRVSLQKGLFLGVTWTLAAAHLVR